MWKEAARQANSLQHLRGHLLTPFEIRSGVSRLAPDPLWAKIMEIVANFRIAIPDLQDDYESSFIHSSS